MEEADGDSDTATAAITVNDTDPVADFTATPGSGDEALTVDFSDTSISHDGIITRTWDFGDSSSSSETNPSHQYTDDGVYTVTLTVEEADGDSDTATAAITVNNVAPTVEAGNNKDATEGATVSFIGSFTDPGPDDTHTIEWDFGDGTGDTGSLTTSHVYTDNGTFIATLTVRDDDGGEGSDTLTVNVSNVAPMVLAGGGGSANEGESVSFNGNFSDPGEGDTHTIEWNFGDGNAVTGTLNTSHIYSAAGTYTATLTVTDDDGGEDSKSLTVNINNVPPTADISGPPTQTAGLDAIFDASGSTEPGGNISAYAWDLDDDGQYNDDSGLTITLNLTEAGTYPVALHVTDAENTTGTAQTTITIEPAALDHFVVSVPVSSTAGVAFSTVITAEDEYGNIITDWDEDVTLTTTNGGNINPIIALGSEFEGGVWSRPVSLTTSGDGRVVRAVHNSHSGQDTLHIEPAAATNLVFSAIGQQTAGVQNIPPFNLTAYDPYGNQDSNYDDFKSLEWSGLMTSPDGTGPIYPSDLVYFEDGVSDFVRFTAFNAEIDVTLIVTESSGPGGVSEAFTVTHAAADEFVFSTIADQTAGASGAFTISVQDEYGNTATGYSGARTLNWNGLGDSPNGDPPAYPPNPVSFSGGIASSLVFTPYLVETGAQITADEGSISGSSNTFNVNVSGTVGEVVIESAAGGSGSEVTTHDMVIYEDFTVYAAGYDAWGNYIADQTVDWNGTGVAVGRLNPASGASTTLRPVISGTATIEAQLSPTISDTTGLITARAPVLEVTLSGNPGTVEAGATLTYTIHYSNSGNASASGTVLTLTPDANVDLGSGYGQAQVWNLGEVGVGSGQVIATGAVRSPLDNGTVLESEASLDSDQTDPVTDSAQTNVHSQPVLHIVKSGMPNSVQAGSSIFYTLVFSNTGNMDATGVVVSDIIPLNTVSSVPQEGVPAGETITWNVGALGAGESEQRTLIVNVNHPLPGGTIITNSGYQIDSDQTAPVTGPDVTTNVLAPTLTIDQAASSDPVEAGALITFTLFYSNTGAGVASSVRITNILSSDIDFVSASDGGTESDGVVTWPVIPTLGAHQGGQHTVVARVNSPLPDDMWLYNDVIVDSSEEEPTPDRIAVRVNSEPLLHISKVAASDPVQAGAQLLYTIYYTNTGNADATGVIVADTLPAHTTFVSASDGGSHDDGVVTWNLSLLDGEGGVGSVTLAVMVESPLADGTMLENAVSISCDEGTEADASTQTEVDSLPELHLNVNDNPDPVKGEHILVYTVQCSNQGNANATNVELQASYDARLTFVEAYPPPSSGDNIWSQPLLPGEGGTGTVVITLTTDTLAPEATLNSTFRLRSAEVGWVSLSEETEAEAVDLALDVSHGETDDAPHPGEQIIYTLDYSNKGDIPATGVELTAQLPDGTTYQGSGWSAAGGGSYRYTQGTLNAGAGGSVEFIVQVNDSGDSRLPSGMTSIEPTFYIQDDGQNGPEFYTADNQTSDFVGIPDLVIDEIRVTPTTPTPNRPVTFTVVIRNKGTGWAWNPNNHGGFFVDLFIDPDSMPQSYPWDGDGDIIVGTSSLAPGGVREVVLEYPKGLSDQHHDVYAKIDNYPPYPSSPSWQQSSLVPESDEENNVLYGSVEMGAPDEFYVFLPAVMRNHQ